MKDAKFIGTLFFILVFLAPHVSSAVIVSTVTELENAVENANGSGDKQIILAANTYYLNGVYLAITADGVTIKGATTKRSDVILDGQYVTREIFQISGSNTTIKDLTLKEAVHHPIHIFPDSHDVIGTLIKNVHIIDPGQQAIKINQNAAKTYSVNFGTVEMSKIELTAAGRARVWDINGSCYTGGVDAHHAKGWNIKDNVISGFWCPNGLSEHGIHFWSFSSDTIVERNRIINCDRGIGFGLGSSGHTGGIIRNNMIYHDTGHDYSDVGIGLEFASAVQVYNNTIFQEHPYPNAIEYRFSETSAVIKNNLTNKAISSREGGTASESYNVKSARQSWFKNTGSGDLHLAGPLSIVVDKGTGVTGLRDDFDRETRPMGYGYDIGADEWTATEKGSVSTWLQLLLED